jgi:sulfite reductase alpha subunit-like flavoprotein
LSTSNKSKPCQICQNCSHLAFLRSAAIATGLSVCHLAAAFAETRDVPQVLLDFPSCNIPLADLLEAAPRLKPRQFSISSSPLAHLGRIHITVAVVDFRTPFKRRAKGLCSSWLGSITVGCALDML